MNNAIKSALAAIAIFTTAPLVAQTMTSADTGAEPVAGMSGPDYVKMAADSDNFEIQSGRLAASKSHRADVKGFGKQMAADHMATSKSLMAALINQDRKITAPSTRLSSANQAKLDLLKKAPKTSFDELYLRQQVDAHQTAWALHKGYADNGTDPTLKQVATTTVPVIERHLSMAKAMVAAGM